MGETFLYMLKPVLRFLPEVREPEGRTSFREKLLWTGITLFIYLICCQLPLYGIYKTSSSDPLYWMRVILASNRGTLMELGISPLITSNMLVELLANSKLISYDRNVESDKRLLESAEKLLSIIVSFATAFAYVYSGMYGRVEVIGAWKATLLVLQLTGAAVMVLYLDEMLQKGYGIGAGISLFIATNICENVLWKAFSPVTLKTENGIEFEGAVIALFHFLLTKSDKTKAVYMALFRSNLTNLHSIAVTMLVFLVMIYFQGFQVNIPLANRSVRGAMTNYPVKLFYLSNTPIIIQTAVISNLHLISNILYRKFKKFQLIRLLGTWKTDQYGRERLIGGVSYYLVPPDSLREVFNDPVHFFVYLSFIAVSCAVLSKMWLELSGKAPVDVLRQLQDSKMVIAKHDRSFSMISLLNKYIPTATVIGGVLIALLSFFSDLLGTVGSGTGLLLVVNIIYGFMESFAHEKDEFAGLRDIIEY